MAPMCTPEKTKESHSLNNLDELYFIPQGNPDEESITDCSDLDDSDDDEVVREKMDKLLSLFPELEKNFNLHGQVGEGTFSTVYVAALKNGKKDERFAIKHIVPTCHPERIKFELNCLKQIGGTNNVVGVNLCLRNLNNVIFVMPYQQHDYFAEYVGLMDADETRLYMFNLLTAIAHVHDFQIIHRDIKPSNFLYDRQHKKFLLVDFGLAQRQAPSNNEEKCITATGKRKRSTISTGQQQQQPEDNAPRITYIQFDNSPELKQSLKNRQQLRTESCTCYGKSKVCSLCMLNPPLQASRAGTPGFRPPEVLFKYPHQTTAVDIWAAGIILLSILSNCCNFFSCPNDIAALLELVTIFGYDNIVKIGYKFGRQFICSEKRPPLELRKICCCLRKRGELDDLLSGETCTRCTQFRRLCLCRSVPMDQAIPDAFPRAAYDLLGRLLDLSPHTRITAKQALAHAFFRSA